MFNMKNISLSFVLFLLIYNYGCGEASSAKKAATPLNDSAEIKFVSELINIGLIEPNKNANQDFKFFNGGKTPLTISEAKGNCHCVQAKWPDKPIASGDSSVISISFDPTGVTGLFQRTVMVNSNATRPAVELTITGEIKADPNKKNLPAENKH
jgi:hypothetical protein